LGVGPRLVVRLAVDVVAPAVGRTGLRQGAGLAFAGGDLAVGPGPVLCLAVDVVAPAVGCTGGRHGTAVQPAGR